MTAITLLNKSNVPIGPFTRAEVAAKLQSGEVSLDDLAFVEGLSQWTPLREVLAKVDAPAATVPPPVMPPPVTAAVAPGYSYAATMQPPAHLAYAGFWIRFVAHIIDSFVIMVPFVVVIVILGFMVGGFAALGAGTASNNSDASTAVGAAMGLGIILAYLGFLVAIIVLPWLYFAKMESGPGQATYGKRAMGLRVTNMAGERISFGRATGRYFGKIVSNMTMYIGYIMVAFTERKQALHDMMSETLVVIVKE